MDLRAERAAKTSNAQLALGTPKDISGSAPGAPNSREWRSVRLKHVADVSISNVDKHTVDGESSVRLCNYADVYNREVIDGELDFMHATASPEQIRKFTVRAGDVLITKDSETPQDIAVPAYVPSEIGDVVCGYHLALVRARSGRAIGRFLMRLFQARNIQAYFEGWANGITRFGLTQYSLKNAPLTIPSVRTQAAIADFLDRETANADGLIENYKKLIALLEEKRVTLITQAVTKGLDPNVLLKDSGVEWIGQIPAHWAPRRVKFCATKIGSGITPRGGAEVYTTTGVTFLRSQNVYNDGLRLDDVVYIPADVDVEMCKTRLRECDVLLNITGASIGRTCIVPSDALPANVNQHVCIIRPATNVLPAYLSYSLKGSPIRNQIISRESGSSREGLNYEQVGNLVIIVPDSIDEQQTIADTLNRRIAEIDTLIKKSAQAISLIRENRSALISAAVTGQINVRSYKAYNIKVPT